MGVEGIDLLARGNEAAEAEPFQDTVRALVVMRGEESGAESFFQAWMEC